MKSKRMSKRMSTPSCSLPLSLTSRMPYRDRCPTSICTRALAQIVSTSVLSMTEYTLATGNARSIFRPILFHLGSDSIRLWYSGILLQNLPIWNHGTDLYTSLHICCLLCIGDVISEQSVLLPPVPYRRFIAAMYTAVGLRMSE